MFVWNKIKNCVKKKKKTDVEISKNSKKNNQIHENLPSKPNSEEYNLLVSTNFSSFSSFLLISSSLNSIVEFFFEKKKTIKIKIKNKIITKKNAEK